MRITQSGFGRRGAIALLDNEEAQQAQTENTETGDNANSLETDLVEVTDSAGEGEAEDQTIQEAVDTKEALESYQAALEQYMAEGGINSQAAHFLKIGLEHFNIRQDIRESDRVNIAVESFGGASSKMRSNQAALEGIKEQLQKVWESIKAAIKRAIEWLKEHFNKIFGAAEKLEKRAKSLADKAKEVSGNAKESKFENERLVKALHIGGALGTGLSASLERIAKAGDDVFTKVADFGSHSGEAMLGALQSEGKLNTLSAPAFVPATIKPLSAADQKANGFDAPPENMGLFRSEELPGGKAILARYPTKNLTGMEAVNAYANVAATLTNFNNKAADVSKSDCPTLPSAEMGKIADIVANMARSLIGYRAKADKATEMKNKISAAAEKLSKEEIKEDDKTKKEWMQAMQKLASASVNVIDKPAPQFAQYMLVTGKAALDYVEESLKQYSK